VREHLVARDDVAYLSNADRHVNVGVGELETAAYPSILTTQALGSCVGIALWDPTRQTGGMAHVMLPSSEDTRMEGRLQRFATHAVPELIAVLESEGSSRRRLVAKIAGGAAMFKGDSMLAGIGARNIEEVRRQLHLAGVRLRAEDTGGDYARTIELHLDTGILLVRSYQYGIREI
jgi:chemotaxis protein CheD